MADNQVTQGVVLEVVGAALGQNNLSSESSPKQQGEYMEIKAIIQPRALGYVVLSGGEALRERKGDKMIERIFPSTDAAIKHLSAQCAGFNASFPLNRMTAAVQMPDGSVTTVGGSDE